MKIFPFLKDFRQRRGAAGGFILGEDDIPKDTQGCAGVYVIETNDGFKFPYPTGNSKVIYIGKSDRLMARLKEHRKAVDDLWDNVDLGIYDDGPWPFNRHQYMRHHGAKVYYYKCLRKQEAKELESRVMWAFYKKYHAIPVGNGAKSYSKK